MKKLSWLNMLAVAGLLSACTSDDDLNNVLVEAQVGDSEVEIQLSSTSQQTRTSIVSDEAGLFNLDGLGIFCVAKSKQNPEINPPAPDVNWTRYGEYGKTDVLLYNVEANAVKIEKTEEERVWSETSIQWAEEGKQYFYPISNWYKYDFYGYYPKQDDSRLTLASDYIAVSMTIDGTKDVIWGKATSEEQYAYSAKYFRTEKHQLPVLNFIHCLTRFTFSVEAGADYSGSKENATRMKVKEIKLLDMPYEISMMLASNADYTLGQVAANTNYVKDFMLLGENDQTFAPVQVHETDRQLIGDALIVVPELEIYGISILLEDEKGNEYLSEFPLSINHFEGGTFAQAGHSYNINMVVYGPQEIGINATLEPWIVEETDVEIEL